MRVDCLCMSMVGSKIKRMFSSLSLSDFDFYYDEIVDTFEASTFTRPFPIIYLRMTDTTYVWDRKVDLWEWSLSYMDLKHGVMNTLLQLVLTMLFMEHSHSWNRCGPLWFEVNINSVTNINNVYRYLPLQHLCIQNNMHREGDILVQ